MQQPPQRVSPLIFPEQWDLPVRPEQGQAASLDAFRQTEFQLRSDLRLLHEGMNLQLMVVAGAHPARYRTHAAAVMQMYWSRAFHYLSDCATLVPRGSYVSVPPLVRTACECISAAAQLSGDEVGYFISFLAESLRPHEQHRATEIGRGSYHAGGTLAANERLGLVYRTSTELARPHFGATMIEVAPESNLQKLSVAFADQAFHFGWAQLELGWVIALCAVLLQAALERGDLLGTTAETHAAVDAFVMRADTALGAAGRCRIDEVEEAGDRRFLISNFRRQPAGAPRKLLL